MINSFLASNYEEVSYDVFYRDVFPVGSFEKKGIMEDGKYKGIAVSIASVIFLPVRILHSSSS